MIAGLAPGLQGANRTGRPFTGDWAGDLLYATLLKHGLAKGEYDERTDDTLELVDCRIANSVRCVPPQNKPEPSEIKTCRQFLISELEVLPNVKVILALGKIAHDSVLKTLDARIAAHPFKHGVVYELGRFKLISSYHCSRYNTNTGVLTTKMFEDVVGKAKKLAKLCYRAAANRFDIVAVRIQDKGAIIVPPGCNAAAGPAAHCRYRRTPVRAL